MANEVAYGFTGLQHLMAQRVQDVNVGVINTAILQSMQEYNRSVEGLLGTFVTQVTVPTERILLAGSGTLQPVDEWGNPVPTRPGGFMDVGYPIQMGADAFGTNRISREYMTVDELNRQVLTVQQRDADWLRRHLLAALLDDGTWTYADPQYGNLTVQPLADGTAGQLYNLVGGQIAAADDHTKGQAAGIADATNPFTDIETELGEHPVNAGSRIVAFVAPSNIAATRALATFIAVGDPDVELGANTARVTAAAAGVQLFGERVWGKVGNVWIVEWAQMPADYILGVAIDSEKVLGMRQHPFPALQGLFPEENNVDGNLLERRWFRACGFGARNRVGAIAYRVGNATYATPTGFSTPLGI